MQQSITFSGELDERSVDKEVEALNRRLQEAGDIEVNAVGGPGGVGGVGGGAGGGMAGGDDGVGVGAVAEGIGGLQGALEARMPKAIGSAGGMAAKAAPVALAGAVGVGMVSAMASASASMQTSATILGNAWNRVWRPIGDRVDELFIRDAVKSLSEDTRSFESQFREGNELGAFSTLASGRTQEERENAGIRDMLFGSLGAAGGTFAGAKVGAVAGGTLGSIVPGAGTAAGAAIGGIGGGIIGGLGGARAGRAIEDMIPDFPDWLGGIIPSFPNWLQNSPGIIPTFPSWDSIVPDFPGWPNIRSNWPGWPNVPGEWPGWPSINAQWPGWPDLNIPSGFWPDLSPSSILGTVFPAVRAGQIVSEVFGGADVDSGGTGGLRDRIPGFARGGMVNRRQIVEVGERGPEVIAPFSELRSMMENMDRRRQSAGSADVDTSTLESQLNNVERELRRLRSAMDVTVQVGREEIARATQKGQVEDVADTDPTV